jgi:hypothetical protein
VGRLKVVRMMFAFGQVCDIKKCRLSIEVTFTPT